MYNFICVNVKKQHLFLENTKLLVATYILLFVFDVIVGYEVQAAKKTLKHSVFDHFWGNNSNRFWLNIIHAVLQFVAAMLIPMKST